jgi:hypothetical protein
MIDQSRVNPSRFVNKRTATFEITLTFFQLKYQPDATHVPSSSHRYFDDLSKMHANVRQFLRTTTRFSRPPVGFACFPQSCSRHSYYIVRIGPSAENGEQQYDYDVPEHRLSNAAFYKDSRNHVEVKLQTQFSNAH